MGSGNFYNLSRNGNQYLNQTRSVRGKPYLDQYALKAGYETRFLGKGDNQDGMGALATFTNDYDDNWDSYDSTRDRSNYGIFKMQSIQPQIDAFKRQQEEGQAALTKQFETQQADITKQLQIVQGEKSAVSKMTQEYTAMLEKEADAKAKAQEAARVSAATSAANQSRQGQTSNLQIQPASGTARTAGTQPFKRRQLQFNPQTYGGVSSMKSGTLNI